MLEPTNLKCSSMAWCGMLPRSKKSIAIPISSAARPSPAMAAKRIFGANPCISLARAAISNRADVFTLENALWRAVPNNFDHGAADLFGRENVGRKNPSQHREQRFGERIEKTNRGRLGLRSVQRFNDTGPKHVRGLKGQTQQCVFGLAFDPRPHGAPV